MSTLEQNVTVENKGIVTEWLDKNFRNSKTKNGYRVALLLLLKAIYGEKEYSSLNDLDKGVEKYLTERRNLLDDVKGLAQWMNSKQYAPMTIHNFLGCIRKFCSRHGIKIEDDDWNDLKTLIPSNVVITQDDILTKEQLREVIKYLPIHAKAITLFLVSTGCRIGETLQLKVADLNLDADPPEALLRARTTKKGVGQRFVFMNYEARDAIKDWLKIASTPTLMKPGRAKNKKYNLELVFDISEISFSHMWWRALKKAGLDKQDPETKYYIFHIHTLRKFFETNMTLHGMKEAIVQGLMGHSGYLHKAYLRIPKEQKQQEYKQHMDAVTIYEYSATRDVQALKEEMQKSIEGAKNAIQENIKLKENEQFLEETFKEFDVDYKGDVKQSMVDLVHKLKDHMQIAIPQPSKSEEVKPIPVTQTPIPIPIKPREISEQPTPKPIITYAMTRACPLKGAYVPKRECDNCPKTNGSMAFSDCYNMQQRFKRGNPTEQDKALFDFAIVNGEYQIEK
jgi:integrase